MRGEADNPVLPVVRVDVSQPGRCVRGEDIGVIDPAAEFGKNVLTKHEGHVDTGS